MPDKRARISPGRRLVPLLLALTASLPAAVAQPPGVETSPDESDIPDGAMLIHGDIIVPLDFYDQPEAAFDTNTWPDGIVYFEFDGNVSSANQQEMRLAMQEWINVAGVAFVPRTGWEDNWVHIQDSSGNNSWVGLQDTGSQVINIHNWDYRFIIAHELCHALGFFHEQSRPDRDTACNGGPCVTIVLGNVCQDCCSGDPCDHNFEIVPGAGTLGPYDFDSVMHYDQCAFSTDADCPDGGQTIIVPPPFDGWQDLIGQRDHLSTGDIDGMVNRYGSQDSLYVDGSSGGGNGTLPSPYASFTTAAAAAPDGARIFVRGGNYAAVGTYSDPLTVRAHSGDVHLGD